VGGWTGLFHFVPSPVRSPPFVSLLAHRVARIACIKFRRVQNVHDLDGFATLGADGDHRDGRLQQFFQAFEVGFGGWWEIVVVIDAGCVGEPAGDFFVDGFAGGEVAESGGEAVDEFAA
jgi:hypothetical protein